MKTRKLLLIMLIVILALSVLALTACDFSLFGDDNTEPEDNTGGSTSNNDDPVVNDPTDDPVVDDPAEPDTTYYTVSFDSNGGSAVASIQVESGLSIVVPTAPTLDGYTFAGWYEENCDTAFDLDSAMTCNVELTAKWTATVYSITYVGFDGVANDNTATAYTIESDTIEFVEPTKTGYTATLDVATIAKGSIGAVTVTASWTAIEYSIIYVGFEGATNTNASAYTIEDAIELVDPTKTDYIATLDVTSIDKGSTGNITVTATWQRATNGLSYTSIGQSYTVSGIGTATDTDIFIPSTYNRLPITSISSSAFSGCSSLTSVTIGDSVVSIYNYAFYGCSSLIGVTIPESVTSIGEYAFQYCTSLETVYYNATNATCSVPLGYKAPFQYSGSEDNGCELIIGDNVVSIGSYIFYDFDYLTSVVIPDSVTSIGSYVFYNCISLTSVTIGDSVTSIGDYAFYYCSSLTSVIIPDSVVSLGSYAFHKCSSLTSVVIPDSVTSIGSYAFEYCSGIQELIIGSGVTSIGSDAFQRCTSLETVYYNATNAICATYSIYAPFDYSGSSENGCTLIIGNNVESIGKYMFYGFDYLTSVTIPDSVTSIGERAFQNCTSLETVYYNATNATCNASSSYAPFSCSGSEDNGCELIIGDNVENIGSYMFYDFDYLTTVTIGDKVTCIGEYVFCYCTSLTSVAIPDSVISIGSYAFRYCSSLASVVIGDSVTSIGNYAFYNCIGLTSAVIGNSVTSIGNYAFQYCTNLTSVTIGSGVTSIGTSAFQKCTSLETVYYNATNATCNTSYSNSAPFCYSGSEDNGCELIIGDNVENIGNSMFYDFDYLTSVVIPDSVTSIGISAFGYCSRLTDVYCNGTIADWCGISFGNSSANPMCYANNFYMLDEDSNCDLVTEIEIPDSVTAIGDYQFYSFSGVTIVTIPDSVTSISSSAFRSCSSLQELTIGSGVTSIGDSAFQYCTSLETVYYNAINADYTSNVSSSAYYSTYAPFSCSGSEDNGCELVIGDNVESIGDYMFYNFDYLTTAGIEDSVTSIGSSAFRYCTSLQELTIGSGVTSIGDYAFQYCSSLTSVVIGEGVTSIGDDAFRYCSGLTSVTIPDSVVSMGEYAFQYCTSLETVYYNATNATCSTTYSSSAPFCYSGSSDGCQLIIGDNVCSIGSYMFYDFDYLTSVVIPDGVTSIGSSAFYGCSSLTSVVIGDSVTSIGNSAFRGCSSLTSVVIPDSVTSIGASAFNNCSSLTSVTIPDSVTSIGNYAFYGCTSLTSVVFEDTTTWYVTTSSSDASSMTDGTVVTVTDPATAATYLKSTYYNYYWYKL